MEWMRNVANPVAGPRTSREVKALVGRGRAFRALSASADDGAEILVRQDEQVFASHCHGTPVCLLYADAVTSAWLPPCVGRGSPETAPWATKGTVIR
jgi:hypothetical protein